MSILVICCLICSISANSLLFTPHHIMMDVGTFSNGLIDDGSSQCIHIRVDSDGKRGQLNIQKIKTLRDINSDDIDVFDHQYPRIEHFYHIQISLLIERSYIHSLPQTRILLFPFHHFL